MMTNPKSGSSPARWWLWGVMIGSALLLLACNETTTPAWGTPAAPEVTSTALRPTVESAGVDLYLSEIEAHEAERSAQATLQAVYAQQTATAAALQATATQQAWRATATADAQRSQATATAEARHAAATATAWIMTVEAERVQATATAEAQRRAEERAAQAANATATADTIVFQATVAAIAADREAVDALNAEILERERLTTERERLVYPIRAYGPWVLLACAAALGVYGVHLLLEAYNVRLRALSRDERGDAPVLVLHQGKRVQIIDVDPNLHGVLEVDEAGRVQPPQLTDEQRQQQERVKRRDQMVDLFNRGLPGEGRSPRRPTRKRAAQLMLSGPTVAPPPGAVQIIDPQQVKPWLRDVEPKALAGAVVEGEILEES
jgi:hypothetical protein